VPSCFEILMDERLGSRMQRQSRPRW
jgi:hypothetical protein